MRPGSVTTLPNLSLRRSSTCASVSRFMIQICAQLIIIAVWSTGCHVSDGSTRGRRRPVALPSLSWARCLAAAWFGVLLPLPSGGLAWVGRRSAVSAHFWQPGLPRPGSGPSGGWWFWQALFRISEPAGGVKVCKACNSIFTTIQKDIKIPPTWNDV